MNLLDRTISYFAPGWGAERQLARLALAYTGGESSRLYPQPRGSTLDPRHQPPFDLSTIRDRARALDRDNQLASSILDRDEENVIGGGLRLQCQSSSPRWNAKAEDRWEQWQDECDVRGLLSFDDYQRLYYRCYRRDGDAGTILIDDNGFPRLQMIEGDQIETPPEKALTVIDGIECDDRLKPLTFYVKNQDLKGHLTWTPIGARDFVFLIDQYRSRQVRGYSIFTGCFGLFDQLDGYVEAVVTAARAGACQAMLIKKTNPSGGPPYPTTLNQSGETQRAFKLEPLTVHYLGLNEDATGFNPSQPTQEFAPFISTLGRIMGTKFGLSLEQVLLDFSQTSYSSSRAARQQAEHVATVERARIARTFHSRVFRWWASKMIANGELPDGPADYFDCEWLYEGQPWVDPTKEIQSATQEVANNWISPQQLIKERGRDPEQVLQEIADWEVLKQQYGIQPPPAQNNPQGTPTQPGEQNGNGNSQPNQ